MDVKIIVAAHKKYRMPSDDMYLPLQVGAKGKEFIGYMRDDEGDNISDKNDTYSELTGMYYAWKNIDAKYLGLVHYRRYFATNKLCFDKDPFKRVLTYPELKKYLEDYDVIVPNRRRYYIETLFSHYSHTLEKRHLKVAYKIIVKHYPEYIGACNRVYRRTWGYMFNMFIAGKDIWDDYCTWIFDILRIMEYNIDVTKYDEFDKRLFGRVSEILFNVWLEYHMNKGLKVKEVRCIHMEKVNWIKKGGAFLNAKFLGRKYNKSF